MLANTTQNDYRPQQWQVHDNKQRLFAASFAILITVCLALQFNRQSVTHFVSDTQNQFITLLMFDAPPVFPRKDYPQEATEKIIRSQSFIKPTRGQLRSQPVNTLVVTAPPSSTPLAAQQTSTPLQIDSKVIGRAYNDSKSDIQKMAEASGKELNTPLKTKYDRFQTAAEEAVIPDCLSPQGPGGLGLLAIPVIAFSAATGKCK
jgi:hypothetical protein